MITLLMIKTTCESSTMESINRPQAKISKHSVPAVRPSNDILIGSHNIPWLQLQRDLACSFCCIPKESEAARLYALKTTRQTAK